MGIRDRFNAVRATIGDRARNVRRAAGRRQDPIATRVRNVARAAGGAYINA